MSNRLTYLGKDDHAGPSAGAEAPRAAERPAWLWLTPRCY